jgi:phosphomannomutase
MSGIFKAYDVRGRYPGELNETIAWRIGSAFARYLRSRRIVIGQDMRLSSPALAQAFMDGVLSAGCNVVDIGMVTTPLLYYALIAGGYDGGAMVTASHLPADMNGFKFCRQKAVPLSRDQGLPEIERMVSGGLSPESSNPRGRYEARAVLEEYIDELARFILNPKSLNLVVDAGNGMVGPELSALFRRCPQWKVLTLYMEPDGRFPNHVANPLIAENTRALQQRVLTEKADIGIAFDGDADRCGFIDEQGRRIREDLITAFISEYYLGIRRGEKILYDLRSSRTVPETIIRFGGIPIRSRVGHSFIKEKMRSENAVFAGELSGHYYYRDTGFTDNALFTMIQMLNFLAGRREPLSQMLAHFEKYCSTGEINLKAVLSDKIFRSLDERFLDAEKDRLDGLTVSFDSWWFNVRASNTEPLIRLNLEANTRALMEEKRDEVLGIIKKVDPDSIVQSQ